MGVWMLFTVPALRTVASLRLTDPLPTWTFSFPLRLLGERALVERSSHACAFPTFGPHE